MPFLSNEDMWDCGRNLTVFCFRVEKPEVAPSGVFAYRCFELGISANNKPYKTVPIITDNHSKRGIT